MSTDVWTAHVAGPVRHGLQMCVRCGTVLLNDEIAGMTPGTISAIHGFPSAAAIYVSPDNRMRTTFAKKVPAVVPCAPEERRRKRT